IEAIRWTLAELVSRVENQQQPECGSAAALPAVDSLKQEVMRTQGSLQTVHGTLGKVIERLGTIETGIRSAMAPSTPAASVPAMRGPRPPEERLASPPMASTAPSKQPPAPISAPPAPSVAASSGPRPAAASNSPKPVAAPSAAKPQHGAAPAPPGARPADPPKPQNSAGQEFPMFKSLRGASPAGAPPVVPRPIEPKLPPNQPPEGSRTALPTSGASPAERIAASEASLGSARLPVVEAGPKPDFIAAARRAAQAASGSFGEKA